MSAPARFGFREAAPDPLLARLRPEEVTGRVAALEEEVAAVLVRRGRHIHRGRPDSCDAPDCRGLHPAVAFARSCEAAARVARRSLVHVHRFEGGVCVECGQRLLPEVAA